jgi:Skp family chaperone for outer membrane proteins
VVNRLSKSGNYNFVFDVGGVTAYQTPIILYTDGQNDLTEAVIKELNSTAPPGTNPGDSTSKEGGSKK